MKYARRCDATGLGINEGYVVGDGELYFGSEEDLLYHLRSRGGMDGLSNEFILKEAYEQDEYYWTVWDEVDEDEWYDADGNAIEI